MQTKSRAFSMPILRKRAKVMMRKKHKKTIALSDLDKVWKDWVEYAVIRPLIEYGKVQIDEKTSIEIVGKRVIDDTKAFNLLSNGRAVTKGGRFIEAKDFGGHRSGITYKIVFTDTNYKKGQLIFISENKLSKRVSEHLINTQQYYRIENVNK